MLSKTAVQRQEKLTKGLMLLSEIPECQLMPRGDVNQSVGNGMKADVLDSSLLLGERALRSAERLLQAFRRYMPHFHLDRAFQIIGMYRVFLSFIFRRILKI